MVALASGASDSLAETDFQRRMSELTVEFVECAQDTVEQLRGLLVAVSAGKTSRELAHDELFRAAHNVKGSAGTYGYGLVGAIAHRLDPERTLIALRPRRVGDGLLGSDRLTILEYYSFVSFRLAGVGLAAARQFGSAGPEQELCNNQQCQRHGQHHGSNGVDLGRDAAPNG